MFFCSYLLSCLLKMRKGHWLAFSHRLPVYMWGLFVSMCWLTSRRMSGPPSAGIRWTTRTESRWCWRKRQRRNGRWMGGKRGHVSQLFSHCKGKAEEYTTSWLEIWRHCCSRELMISCFCTQIVFSHPLFHMLGCFIWLIVMWRSQWLLNWFKCIAFASS